MRELSSRQVAALAWMLGITSVWCDHLQPGSALDWVLHATFAVGVCAAISAVVLRERHRSAGALSPDLQLRFRVVSRWVYILMYGLAVLRVCLYLDEALHASAIGAMHPRPLDDFQFYIACCVIPLWLARAVALHAPPSRRAAHTASQHPPQSPSQHPVVHNPVI